MSPSIAGNGRPGCRKSHRFSLPSQHLGAGFVLQQPMPVFFPMTVRFRDLDALGHVNNAVYLSYIEAARLDCFSRLAGLDPAMPNFMFARAEIDYLRPVFMRDQVIISTSIGKIGTKSVQLLHEISANGHLAAKANTVLVWYNHQLGQSEPVPDDVRAEMLAFEAKNSTTTP
jgi:acyl-CoA thioester hydrolase